jgi:ubiquinone/menaquinone biosynthesis C-methylase UbiE
MKVENKDFWENDTIIATQDKEIAYSHDYEVFLYKKVADYLKNKPDLKAKIFGCGTGREIPEVITHIGVKTVVASDIAENMIKKCRENLKKWGLSNLVETIVGDATLYDSKGTTFDVVTLMNNMMTYVIDKNDRDAIFRNAYHILNPEGCIIGVVHNQMGTPQKSIYFIVRRLLKPFLSQEVGFRFTGFKGLKFGGYYFTNKEVHQHLMENNFKNIEVITLSEYYKNKKAPYNRLKGYNNLLFFATK